MKSLSYPEKVESVCLDGIVALCTKNKYSLKQTKNVFKEYESRVNNLIQITHFHEFYYSQIYYKAYRGIVIKYDLKGE